MSTSTAPKSYPEYSDRTEPRSTGVDYSSNGNTSGYSGRHHYTQEHNNGYNDEYYEQQHYGNGHNHHPTPPSSTSHYSHGSSGSFPPHPIQTTSFSGHTNGSSQATHNNSFVPPASSSSSPMSSNGNQHGYQHQQQNSYDYDHPQYHGHHGHNTSYPQDHHQHPLSPPEEGNGHHLYNGHNGHSAPNKAENGNGSYSGYSRNHTYSSSTHGYSNNGHSSHGSFDSGIPDSHDPGLGIAPEGIVNGANGKHDSSSMIYSSSAPSLSTAHSLAARPKRRTETFGNQESPYFYPAQQHYNLHSMDRSKNLSIKINAKIDRGFFLASNDWTCYRRNYFQLSAAFNILGHDLPNEPDVPCLIERNGELVTVRAFLVCIGAQIQHGEKVIELVQHTPKRDKGPQITPRPTHIRAGGDLNLCSSGTSPNVVSFERVQFKTATANNGKRRAAQQYYQVHVDLFAELDNGEQALVASSFSAPLVVRGRSPGHYADNEDGTQESSHGSEARYHYRNDSISSAGGGPLSSPISPSEYSYHSSYNYGSPYPYQSLNSHLASQSHEPGYYGRKDPESYPASPMSNAGPHLGEPLSPDMYSASGFVPGSPSSYHRISQLSIHQHGNGGAYGQYPPYGSHMHGDQDHETRMAALRIQSPNSPVLSSTGSPLATPRRQSFSTSLIAKKSERGVGGLTTTRKSRSISLSGTTMTTTTINKFPLNKPRSARTVPVSPTRDSDGMSSSHSGYSRDRIPESLMEEQHPIIPSQNPFKALSVLSNVSSLPSSSNASASASSKNVNDSTAAATGPMHSTSRTKNANPFLEPPARKLHKQNHDNSFNKYFTTSTSNQGVFSHSNVSTENRLPFKKPQRLVLTRVLPSNNVTRSSPTTPSENSTYSVPLSPESKTTTNNSEKREQTTSHCNMDTENTAEQDNILFSTNYFHNPSTTPKQPPNPEYYDFIRNGASTSKSFNQRLREADQNIDEDNGYREGKSETPESVAPVDSAIMAFARKSIMQHATSSPHSIFRKLSSSRKAIPTINHVDVLASQDNSKRSQSRDQKDVVSRKQTPASALVAHAPKPKTTIPIDVSNSSSTQGVSASSTAASAVPGTSQLINIDSQMAEEQRLTNSAPPSSGLTINPGNDIPSAPSMFSRSILDFSKPVEAVVPRKHSVMNNTPIRPRSSTPLDSTLKPHEHIPTSVTLSRTKFPSSTMDQDVDMNVFTNNGATSTLSVPHELPSFNLLAALKMDSARTKYQLPSLIASLSPPSSPNRRPSPYKVLSVNEREALRSRRMPRFKARPLNPKVFTSAGDLGVPRIQKQPLTVPVSPVFSKPRVRNAVAEGRIKKESAVNSLAASRLTNMIAAGTDKNTAPSKKLREQIAEQNVASHANAHSRMDSISQPLASISSSSLWSTPLVVPSVNQTRNNINLGSIRGPPLRQEATNVVSTSTAVRSDTKVQPRQPSKLRRPTTRPLPFTFATTELQRKRMLFEPSTKVQAPLIGSRDTLRLEDL
ncbi:hypothetical protein BGZ76_001329 [Entomortierella beljakovae]|nr:hypothetical protein BGZ76_001329 [Entomortierella beljakovae]